MVVDQHRQAVSAGSPELRQQDVAGLQVRRADPAGLRAHQSEPRRPVQQRAVYPSRIRRIEMRDLIIQFPQCRLRDQLLKHKAVLHLGHSDDVRQIGAHSESRKSCLRNIAAGPEYCLRHGVALPVEPLLRPPALTGGGELRVRLPRPSVDEIEEVFEVPEKDRHASAVSPFHLRHKPARNRSGQAKKYNSAGGQTPDNH